MVLPTSEILPLFFLWDKCRDEAHARLGQLRDKAEKDLKQYVSEMKELERFLENDRRMSEFVNIKLQERTFTEEALRAKAKKRVYLLWIGLTCRFPSLAGDFEAVESKL